MLSLTFVVSLISIPYLLSFHWKKLKEVGGGGKETLQMIRDDTEKLKLGYLSQAVLF